jgi:subtilisin family serine protease
MSDLDEKYKQMIFDSNVEYLSVYDVFIETPYSFVECVYSGGCGGSTPSYFTPPVTPFKDDHYFSTDVLDAVNATDVVNTYTAEGIKVGIWEALEDGSFSGRINTNHVQFYNRTIVTRYVSVSTVPSLHATQVAIVAAGNDGIARDTIIYSADINPYTGTLIDLPTLQWFANNNVSVVNMSFGTAWTSAVNTGINTRINAFDLFVRDNLIILVVATGNIDLENVESTITMGSPALAYNVISIGSTNVLGNDVASYSVFEVPSTLDRIKPNMVSVGNMNIPDSGYNQGTSFAAPIITGAIALSMEINPVLRLFPEKVFSVLAATSSVTALSPNNYETETYHDEYGSGMIDVSEYIENLIANQTSLVQLNGLTPNTHLVLYETSIVESATNPKKLSVALNWLVSVSDGVAHLSNYNLLIYLNNQLIGECENTVGNVELFRKIIGDSGTLRFEIEMVGSYTGNLPDLIALTWNIQ